MGKFTLLIGLAGGAGAMYLLDPNRGHERRARLSEEAQRLREKLSDEDGRVDPRDIFNRTKESVSDFRHRLTNGQREKMTSELRGAAAELGSTGRWSPGTRLLAAGVGSGLAIYGIRRTSLVGLGLAAAGLALTAKAVMNFELRRSSEGLNREEAAAAPAPRGRREESLRAEMLGQPQERSGSIQMPGRIQSEPAIDLDDAATAQDMRDEIADAETPVFTQNPEDVTKE
jgi:hypothetical protein